MEGDCKGAIDIHSTKGDEISRLQNNARHTHTQGEGEEEEVRSRMLNQGAQHGKG